MIASLYKVIIGDSKLKDAVVIDTYIAGIRCDSYLFEVPHLEHDLLSRGIVFVFQEGRM